jgi:hypothetical protein
MELSTERIEAAVIAEVSEKILDNDEIFDRAKKAIEHRVDALWKTTVKEKLQAEVDALVLRGLDHSYTRVDSFGCKVGDATTVRAELEKLIGGYWSARVDRNGKPSDSSYGTTSRAEWQMTQLVAANFSDEMKQHIVNIGGALKDGLRSELHSTVNKLLSEVFHVRSVEDVKIRETGRACIDPPAKPLA